MVDQDDITCDLPEDSPIGRKLRALRAELSAAKERAEKADSKGVENGQSFHPEFCPVTGRPFFMTIEGEDGRMVATYGGPFDSYTIPEWDQEDKEFRSERYDHDAGWWVEGGEPCSFILVDEEEHFELKERAEGLARSLEVADRLLAGTQEEVATLTRQRDELMPQLRQAVERVAELEVQVKAAYAQAATVETRRDELAAALKVAESVIGEAMRAAAAMNLNKAGCFLSAYQMTGRDYPAILKAALAKARREGEVGRLRAWARILRAGWNPAQSIPDALEADACAIERGEVEVPDAA